MKVMNFLEHTLIINFIKRMNSLMSTVLPELLQYDLFLRKNLWWSMRPMAEAGTKKRMMHLLTLVTPTDLIQYQGNIQGTKSCRLILMQILKDGGSYLIQRKKY